MQMVGRYSSFQKMEFNFTLPTWIQKWTRLSDSFQRIKEENNSNFTMETSSKR